MGRFTDWLRGVDRELGSSREVASFHYVPSSSLEQLVVSTRLQNGSYVAQLLRQTAAYRGEQIIEDIVADVPWYAQEGGDPALTGSNTLRRARRLDVQPTVLVRPNPWESRDQTIRKFVSSLIWTGNAYVMGSLFVDGRPTVAIVLDPNEVVVAPDENDRSRARYRWRGVELSLGVNLWHERFNTIPGSLVGIGPFEAGREVILGGVAADKYGRELFTEGAVPSGVLSTPAPLTEEEAQLLRAQWEEQHASGRGTAILGGAIQWEGVSVTPEQGQYLQTRSYTDQEIARLLGIPQWLMNAGSPPGSGSALTYQNVSQPYVEFARTTLKPTYFRRLERVWSAFLPRGQAVGFDLGELTRADGEARARIHETELRAGYKSIEEVRIEEGLDESLDPAEAPAPAQPIPEEVPFR